MLKPLSLLLYFALYLLFYYSVLLLIFRRIWAVSYSHFSDCMILQLFYLFLSLWYIKWMRYKNILCHNTLFICFLIFYFSCVANIILRWSLQCLIFSLGVNNIYLAPSFLFYIIILSHKNLLCYIPSFYLK